MSDSPFESPLPAPQAGTHRSFALVAWMLIAILGAATVLPGLGALKSWPFTALMMLAALIITLLTFIKGGVRQGLALLVSLLVVLPVLMILRPGGSAVAGMNGERAPAASGLDETGYSNAADPLASEPETGVVPAEGGIHLPASLQELKLKIQAHQIQVQKLKIKGFAREGVNGQLQTDERADLAARKVIQQENLWREEVFRQIGSITHQSAQEVAGEFARMATNGQP